MKKHIDVSIVIPVYKSDESLTIIANQLKDLQDKMSLAFQVIYVNDSPFFLKTCNTLDKVSKDFSNVEVVQLRKNQGQHMALLVGLSRAKGEFVITMDDDLQHPVSEIPKLLEAIYSRRDIDAVFAVPFFGDKKHSLAFLTSARFLPCRS